MLCVQLFSLGFYYTTLQQFQEKIFIIIKMLKTKILNKLDYIIIMLWIPDQLCVVLVMADWEIR